LTTLLSGNAQDETRILYLRKILHDWLMASAFALHSHSTSPHPKLAIDAQPLAQARQVLRTIQREAQIDFNTQLEEQDWTIQSSQALGLIPKMEKAVSDMEKEMRDYLLTSDPAFVDAYRNAVSDFYAVQGQLWALVAHNAKEVEQLDGIRQNLETWIARCATPYIEGKLQGQRDKDAGWITRSEPLINNVRLGIEQFEQDKIASHQLRAASAARERILRTAAITLFCVIAATVLFVSSGYSFVLCRRQLRRLQSADTRIRGIIDGLLDGMVTVDENGAVLSMNPAAKKMFGYRDNDFYGEDFTRLVPDYFDGEAGSSVGKRDWPQLVERTGRPLHALAQTHGGGTFSAEISLSEMIVDRHKYYIAMIRDITERKRFEDELAAEKQNLAVTLSSLGEGVITTDLNGRIVVCNPAAESMTGYYGKAAIGRPLKTVLRISGDVGGAKHDSRTGYRSEAEAILFALTERCTLISRGGKQLTIEQMASPIRDKKNELCGVVLVFRDITARQRDEEERRKAETLEQLGLLAGGIAHDFNNLLTAIIGNISLAALLLPPQSEMIERLEDAKNASMRARDLAQQLLTFARGGAPIKKEASIASLIEETVSFSLRGSQSRSDLVIAPDLWSAEFDPGQISQVIANLVVNAEQAMPEGGTLHVACDNFGCATDGPNWVTDLAPGDYIRIQLRDEGVGIPEKHLKQIFDPYFTTKPKGSGLGLATTYSIVKNHNGLITVESELHCGSTFTVYLPAARRTASAPVVADTPANEPVHGSGRILVVDDEEAIRDLVDFALSSFGYAVTGAATALEGIDLYRKALISGERFDLVILDLTLPGGMGGKEALRKLQEIDPMVTAIVSSGYAMDAAMSRYEDFGFRGMIAKPYEAVELGRVVRDVIAANPSKFAQACELQVVC
jgi:PAS domain S-box-containing protein